MNTALKMVLPLVLSALLLVSCVSDNEAGLQIESRLDRIVSDPRSAISSNPNDYIRNQPEAYSEIVGQGEDALAYLTDQLKRSQENGLREWIMAKACADILGNRSTVSGWATGKEWLSKYEYNIGQQR